MQISSDLDLEQPKQVQNNSQVDSSLENASKLIEYQPSSRLALCSLMNNNICIIDLETKQEYANFQGVQPQIMGDPSNSWTHLKEVTNTSLLVSLHHSRDTFANMEIFDISKKGRVRKVYSFEEVLGVTGVGDVSYNPRRSILGAICVGRKIAYHMFKIDANFSKGDDVAKLCRKSKWHSQYNTSEANFVSGLDVDPNGEAIATIDNYGVCLISDVNTSTCNFHLEMDMIDYDCDMVGRCKWSINIDEPLLYIKYDYKCLNVLDVEKKALILKSPFQLETKNIDRDDLVGWTLWIDVCPSNGNLLAAVGDDSNIKIYDRRESKIVKIFDVQPETALTCVRWNPSGDMLASTSFDQKARLFDFKTGKITHTEKILDGSRACSLCFI